MCVGSVNGLSLDRLPCSSARYLRAAGEDAFTAGVKIEHAIHVPAKQLFFVPLSFFRFHLLFLLSFGNFADKPYSSNQS